MTTYFKNPDMARDFGVCMAGVDPKTAKLTEDNTLHVQSAAGFLSDPSTPEGQERIKRDLEGQKGYRFKNKPGVEVGIVVAPFRDGYCVWGIHLETGGAIRL